MNVTSLIAELRKMPPEAAVWLRMTVDEDMVVMDVADLVNTDEQGDVVIHGELS